MSNKRILVAIKFAGWIRKYTQNRHSVANLGKRIKNSDFIGYRNVNLTLRHFTDVKYRHSALNILMFRLIYMKNIGL
jgi:hypothetical protein